MLNKINELEIFFEDCYREVSVREYSRELNISPPTASKVLKEFEKQKLLVKREERGFIFFKANRESKTLKDLSRIYWETKLEKVISSLETLYPKAIILYGSLSKLEARKDSDIDLAVLGVTKKISLENFEKSLKRKIHLVLFDSIKDTSEELRLNIINGYLLRGYIS